jgi:3-oxoadipate enol-lactonase
MWEGQLTAFADRGWRVIAPHFRGFGQIEPGSNQVATKLQPGWNQVAVSAIDDYTGDVIDLLDGLHITDAVVLGLSMGGYVALALLRLAPNYIHALVLADTRPQADTPDNAGNRLRLAQLARDQGIAAVVDDVLPKLVGETTRRDRPAVVSKVRSLALANSVSGVIGALDAMRTRPDSTELLASIHLPTLILVGAEDALTPPAVAEAMHNAIGGSTLVVVPGVGHLSSVEDPDAFNHALANFLEHRV